MTSFNSADFCILEKRPHPSFSFPHSQKNYSNKLQTSKQQNLPIYLQGSRSSNNSQKCQTPVINDDEPHFVSDETYKKVKTEQKPQHSFSNGNQTSLYQIKNSSCGSERTYLQEIGAMFNIQHLEGFQNFPCYGNFNFWDGHHSNSTPGNSSSFALKTSGNTGTERNSQFSYPNSISHINTVSLINNNNTLLNHNTFTQNFDSYNSFTSQSQRDLSSESFVSHGHNSRQFDNYAQRKDSNEAAHSYKNNYYKGDMAKKYNNNKHDFTSNPFEQFAKRGDFNYSSETKHHNNKMLEENLPDYLEEDKTTMISPTSLQIQEGHKTEGNLDGFNFEDHELDLGGLNAFSSPDKLFEKENLETFPRAHEVSSLFSNSIFGMSQKRVEENNNNEEMFEFRIKKKTSVPPALAKRELSIPPQNSLILCEASPSPKKFLQKEVSTKTDLETNRATQISDDSNSTSEEAMDGHASRLHSQFDFSIGEEMFQELSPESPQEKDKEDQSNQADQPAPRKRGRPRKYAPDGSLLVKENVPKPQVKLGKKQAKLQAEIEAYERYLEELKKPYVINLTADPEDPNQKLVYTKIGIEYQVEVDPFNLPRKTTGQRIIAPVWTPEDGDQDFIDDFIDKLEAIIGKKIDNAVSALKLLKENNLNIDDTLEMVRRSPKYYQTYFKVHYRNAKNRFNH